MPYTTKKVGSKTCVYKKDGGKKVGCTSGPVSKYLGALHANADEGVQKEAFGTNMAPPLKISGLIKQLKALQTQHGDVGVKLVNGESGRYEDVNGTYPVYPERGDGLDRTKPAIGVAISQHMHIKDEPTMQETTHSSNITLNGRPVDVNSIEIEDVDPRDRPDFSDAFVAAASFKDGIPLSDEECEQLTQERGDIVNDLAHESLHEQQQVTPIKLTEMLKRLTK
jgi:hypothetical protein